MSSSAAKDIATYIIEATGTTLSAPTGFVVRKKTQETETTTTYASNQFDTALQDIDTEAFQPSTSGSSLRGGRVYLKNGTYTMNTRVDISNDTDADNVKLYLEGETRDGTIIKNNCSAGTSTMLGLVCSSNLVNLTLDGNNTGTATKLTATISNSSGNDKVVKCHNVRFTRGTSYYFRSATADNWQIAEARSCIFEKPASSEDMCSLHNAQHVLIDGNWFDRTNGTFTGNGNCITGACSGGRMIVCNNVLKQLSSTSGNSISIEPNQDTFNVDVHDNMVEHGKIKVGLGGAWSTLAYDISVKDNQVLGGGIEIVGPDSGSHTTQVKHVWVDGNVIKNSYSTAMKLEYLAGLVSCRYNKIVNSNTSLATGNHGGLIWVKDCNNASVEFNLLEMNDKSPPDALYSKYGIRYENLNGSRVQHNTILNNTTQGEVTYQNGSGHTGVNVFSQEIW